MQNDMRDRLINLISGAGYDYDNFIEESHERGLSVTEDFEEWCADHLIANGVIVPPCKVEDTVYCIYNNKVIQGTVRLIRPFISKEETIFKGNIICEIESVFYDDGRKEEVELYVVFEKPYGCERVAYLTKEQAEQKLKELNK